MNRPEDIPMPAWSAAEPVHDELFRMGEFRNAPVPFNPQEVIARALLSAEARGREAERERCAQLADKYSKSELGDGSPAGNEISRLINLRATQIAEAIRATAIREGE